MSQTTLDVAFGILLANLIPLAIIAVVLAVYVLYIFGQNLIDWLQDKFQRRNK
jgi:uncharacterized membrane protein